MLPFDVKLRRGESPYRQIVYAATRAIVSAELAVGAPFPSVRTLSHSLKVNPKTAQKAVAELVRSGLLEVKRGVGTVVAEWGPASPEDRLGLITDDVEQLVVQARRVGITRLELKAVVDEQWRELWGNEPSLAADVPDEHAEEKPA